MHLRCHLRLSAGESALTRFGSSCASLRWAAALAGVIVCCWLMMGFFAPRAAAEAIVEGNVLLRDPLTDEFYADDPFTTTVNEGIPRLGNSINENQGMMNQTNFEGRPDLMGTATTTDDENVNFDIYVGRTSFGELIINGGTELRDEDLVIGGIGELPNGEIRRGTGIVRIENPGSLYNNDPLILPYPFDQTGMSPSVNPRPDDVGFDVYVGRFGTGQLVITLGGRAEIQDAVIVGDEPGATGVISVDGIGSFLGSGGYDTGGSSLPGEQHEMIIGRFGNGTMNITNGGLVFTVKSDVEEAQPRAAAVIGSNQSFVADTTPPTGRPGLAGTGSVTVDGDASRWIIAGSLEIGSYHDARPGGMEDMEGDDAIYPAFTGRGTLNVSNGGVVRVVSPSPDPDDPQPSELDIVIGGFGKLNLDGGTVEITPAAVVLDGIGTPLAGLKSRIINDGVISGSGNVIVGQFRNRALGEIRVGAGEKLLIDSKGRFNPSMSDTELPLQNFGLIEVLGNETTRAELEFVRSPSDLSSGGEPITPFLNQRQGTVPSNGGRSEGDIFAQQATLRFGSDLENHGNLIFTAGDNVVSGDVFNDVDGVIFIDGNNTTVTFEDSIFNSGTFDIGPNASIVTSLVDATLAGAGSLSMTLGGSGNGQQITHLSVVGDLMLDGLLEISLFPGASNPFSPQAGDTFEIMRAVGEMTGDFAAISLPFVSPTVGLFAFPDYALDAYFVTTLAAMPGSGSADLNGDGVVDDTDLMIWQQNLGNPGGLGDINGDGIVDGLDLAIWLMQATGFPGAGALADTGGGFGGGSSGAVPEPSSLALLAIGGLLALARRRRGDVGASVPDRAGRAI